MRGKKNSKVIDFIFNDTSQLVTKIYQYYPLVIDLLARYGQGVASGVAFTNLRMHSL